MTTIQKGLKSVSWPGRIQRIGKRLFYDVAHNEDGFEILLKTLRSMYPQKLINGLFCLKGDKESDRIIHKLIGKFSQLYVSNDVNKFLLDRNDLSKRIHPLLETRGVPGTHATEKITKTIQLFDKKKYPIKIPKFDKLNDDRLPFSQIITSKKNMIFLEFLIFLIF